MNRLAARIRLLRPALWLVLLLALVATPVPLPDRQPLRAELSATPDYFAILKHYSTARAEGVIICGICCSGDTACWTKLRTDFERANPPRGEIEGVCWASQYKWERDPATDKQVQRVRAPIYTRVRFNEREVLNSEYHGRNAGFEWEVGAAWDKFVRESASAEFPQSDGWNWSSRCASINSPRYKEDQDWTKAQEQASYKRVFMPTYGIADSPEERALEAKLKAEQEAREKARLAEAARLKQIADEKAAEAARQRAAAEAARQAEIARAEAERQHKIDAIAAQLGPAKRAEAERLQRMNDQLAALRPKPRPAAQVEQGQSPQDDDKAKQAEAEKAAQERREAEEKAAAERKRLADAKLAEEKRKKEEANRPIEFKEGVVVCSRQSEKSYKCEGPLQLTYSDLVSLPGRTSVALACGKDSRTLDSIRDLGTVNGYRVFGCGYGIHPNSNYPGNRDVPAAYGLYVSSPRDVPLPAEHGCLLQQTLSAERDARCRSGHQSEALHAG